VCSYVDGFLYDNKFPKCELMRQEFIIRAPEVLMSPGIVDDFAQFHDHLKALSYFQPTVTKYHQTDDIPREN
jgi:hypothetical protein